MTVTVFVALVALVSLGADQAEAAPGDDPLPSPLITMEFQTLPTDTLVYPTRGWWNKITLPGILSIENYRPETVYIYLNATVDNGWFIVIDPLMYVVDPTRLDMRTFRVYLHVPPNTFGPGDSVLTIGAIAKVPTRTLSEINISIDVHFLSNVDEMLEALSPLILVTDAERLFTDSVRVCNLLDRPQEFHICALGAWGDRFPDLDFHSGGITLRPQELRNTVFRGHLEGDIEPGVYQVDLALWTPDGDGGRIYILNRTVDMEVFTWEDDFITSILMSGMTMLVITCAMATAVVALVLKVRDRRRLARLYGGNVGWGHNDYHSR